MNASEPRRASKHFHAQNSRHCRKAQRRTGPCSRARQSSKKSDNYESGEYVISSAVGHVVELEMPEDIDKKKYGFWRLETLPIIPGKFELKPIEKVKDRYNALKKLIAHKDIEQLINACDAGRE